VRIMQVRCSGEVLNNPHMYGNETEMEDGGGRPRAADVVVEDDPDDDEEADSDEENRALVPVGPDTPPRRHGVQYPIVSLFIWSFDGKIYLVIIRH